MEFPSLKSDLHFLKEKIKLGADYIITQMFFDNSKFLNLKIFKKKNFINVSIIIRFKTYFNTQANKSYSSQISLRSSRGFNKKLSSNVKTTLRQD